MSPLLAGLAPRGQLIVAGIADDPIQASTADLIVGNRSIVGSNTGTAIENEASMSFSATHGVKAMTEVLPFEEAPKAYERMMSGQARFRVVLDMQVRV
jgi:propanol-preferring alcohol dehydrogenase